MSHAPALPPQAAMLPWAKVGSVAWSLPIVTSHWADPPLPAMSERELVSAHGAEQAPDLCYLCARRPCPVCSRDRVGEERHTLPEWDAIEARQRAFAADPQAVAAEARDIERAQKAGAAGAA